MAAKKQQQIKGAYTHEEMTTMLAYAGFVVSAAGIHTIYGPSIVMCLEDYMALLKSNGGKGILNRLCAEYEL